VLRGDREEMRSTTIHGGFVTQEVVGQVTRDMGGGRSGMRIKTKKGYGGGKEREGSESSSIHHLFAELL